MKELDPKQLIAEAKAHDARMKSSWWTPSDGGPDESWMGPITDAATTLEEEPHHPSRAQGCRRQSQSAAERRKLKGTGAVGAAN